MKYFDLHCDTATECYGKHLELTSNGLHISLEKTEKYDRWAQVFAVWIRDNLRGDAAFRYFLDVCRDFREKLLRAGEKAPLFCRDGESMIKAEAAGRNLALLSIEGAAALAGKIENVAAAREQGVRAITLTWNGGDELADGCMVPQAGGLTPFGKEAVKEMGRCGIAPDVSHLSEKGFWDVARAAEGPFIATHSDSKNVQDHPRNLTDDQFREIARGGGLVGLNLYAAFTGGAGGVEDALRHAERFLELGGEKTIAVGADLDGCTLKAEIRGVEDMSLLYDGLRTRFGQEIADNIFWNNAYRFFTETLK